jgi:hypothetical protein
LLATLEVERVVSGNTARGKPKKNENLAMGFDNRTDEVEVSFVKVVDLEPAD